MFVSHLELKKMSQKKSTHLNKAIYIVAKVYSLQEKMQT